MTPKTRHTQPVSQVKPKFRNCSTRNCAWPSGRLDRCLEEEVTAFIGAPPYARTPWRRDQRNGTYTRDLVTSVGKIEALPVPRTRRGFRTQVFERYQRRQADWIPRSPTCSSSAPAPPGWAKW